jgi:hypothetical protein
VDAKSQPLLSKISRKSHFALLAPNNRDQQQNGRREGQKSPQQQPNQRILLFIRFGSSWLRLDDGLIAAFLSSPNLLSF